MDELPSPEDQLRQRVVVKRSQDGFQPVGVEPVGWSELREGDRVLGMEELLYIFPPHSSSDTSEELASDEDMADMAFHVLECEKVPILDDLIAASTPPDSMEDSKHAGTDGSLKRSGMQSEVAGMGGSLKRSLNTPTIYYFRGSLEQLTFSTDGLFRIVSGNTFGSADFSEMLAGILLSSVLQCKLSLVGIDKTLPRAMRAFGTTASGTPDLYMVSKHGQASKFIVSVKRFYVYDDRVDRHALAVHILAKAVAGLAEYLSIIPLPGNPCIIVLTWDAEDARLVHQVYQSLKQETPIYVIAIDHFELRRLVFRYTHEDAEVIRELFSGKSNLDFATVEDVPWMGKEFMRGVEEEDFTYDDLEAVFGAQFLTGKKGEDPDIDSGS